MMSDGMLGLTQLFLFLFFIMLGFPIAFTLMAMGLFFGYLGMQERVFDLLIQRTYAVISNDVLLSVPLFVFMGYIIERANILDRLFRSLQMQDRLPGVRLGEAAAALGYAPIGAIERFYQRFTEIAAVDL